MQPISSYERATKLEPGISFGGSLAWLHHLAWGNNPQEFFRTVDVHRDTNAIRVDTQVPPTITTLGWMEDSTTPGLLEISEISSIFVRDDYLAILKEITDTNRRETRNSGSVYNPFKKRMQRPSRNDAGAVVTGNPGIGKSTFLIYVLVLRLLASQATILQRTANEFFVMASEGVFRVSPPTTDGLNFHIPKETWVLIDSNSSITEVPLHFIDLRKIHHCFILQAASPSNACVQWTKKVGKTEEYWMAPWALGELIAGRQLQLETNTRCTSESQIASFYEKYGASANTTYTYAAHNLAFERQIHFELIKLSSDVMSKLLLSPFNIELCPLFITARPDPRSHEDCSLDIPTRYVLDLILNQLSPQYPHAALHLFRSFLCSYYTPGADYPLQRAFLEQLPRGGQWPVKRMSRRQVNENTIWTVDRNSRTVAYLKLGYQKSAVQISDTSSDPPVKVKLASRPLPFEGQVELESGFFIPEAGDQASFDSFVFDDREKHAVLFQATLAPQHVIKRSSLTRLQHAGMAAIDLVVVTCPERFNGTREVAMLSEQSNRIRDVYLLEFNF